MLVLYEKLKQFCHCICLKTWQSCSLLIEIPKQHIFIELRQIFTKRYEKTTNLENGGGNLLVLEKTINFSQENNVSTIFLDHENGGIDTFSIDH